MKFLPSPHPPEGSRYRPGLLLGALGLIAFACTFDPDDRCGPNQTIYGDNVRCVCAEGSAMTANGCVPCGSHEVPGASGCVCEAGFTRPTADATCEPAPAALGAACDAQTPCSDATYSHCEPASAGGYCTSVGCQSSSECESGYACDTGVSPSICRRPPIGLGKPCTGAADCADGEATFCESFQTHQCLVQGCSLTSNDCFVGLQCCDLSAFGLPTLCTPQGMCGQ